ncbi:MAG: type IV conjugative transfer system protein TraE [Burkholderiaceae bacterium]|nr:type IV conjugative transfer system protein TraE [Aquabacterium sp.]NUP87358.1 type IV conjugative transfer system protein TraE [Burkholderiaceae bacterium]
MNLTAARQDLGHLRTAGQLQRLVIVLLSATTLVCAMCLYAVLGRERTVLVPPVIEKSFWVQHDKVSASYLEQMASFMAYLVLDTSPHAVDWKGRLLLQYAAPKDAPAFQQKLGVEATRVKQLNATTVYSIKGLAPDEKTMSVRMSGTLATYVNDQRVSDVAKAYRLKFTYTGNRILLQSFEEVEEK